MKKSITIFFLTQLIFGALIMTSCKNGKSDSEDLSGLNPESPFYSFNLKNSLYSLGNNYRAKKVIEKLENGGTVYVAAIGGSVTEGAGPKDSSGKELWQLGYAYKFRDKLIEKYPKATIEFYGAGLSGTPSALGVIRYEKDVVEKLGQNPDLLIVEFSVNDGDECTNTRGFEKIIRNALEAKEDAVVIPVYAKASYQNTQAKMTPVANYYKLPQVSISDALSNPGANVSLEQGGEFLTDYAHPTAEGHNFMADCIMYLLEQEAAANSDEKFEIPADYKNTNGFTDFHTLYSNTEDSNVEISEGGFNETDSNSQTIKVGGTEFPNNWHHSSTSGDENFKITLNCKSFILVYKNQGSWQSEKFGKAEVYVDGVLKETYDGGPSGGWNDCVTKMIIDESTASTHTVEVKMAEDSKNKGFTILALAYNK